MQTITVLGGYNIRDLGGYMTTTGKQTKPHVLLRSGNLDKLPATSQQQLQDYGLRTVIDIRDEWEAAHYPNVFAHSATLNYLNLPLIGDNLSNDATWQGASENYQHLHELYCIYLEACKKQIATIITAISDSAAPTIVHCHAGKDRTGIISALLLSAVGVVHDDIALDYSLSSAAISHLIDEWRAYALQHSQDMQRFERKVASQPETILAMLNYVQNQYGSAVGYLKSCAVSDASLARLEARFLD